MGARVVALHLRAVRASTPMPVGEATGRVGGGLDGDFHVAKTTRAVLVVDRATLAARGLRDGDLREQVTVEGLPDVTGLVPGTTLRIGGIDLRVNGECEPCTHIGELLGVADREAFRVSLLGRRGAVCTVVAANGPARAGDAVEVLAPTPV